MHLLILEDDLDLGHSLQQALRAEQITSVWLRRLADLPANPDWLGVDAVLLDLGLPDGEGLDLLTQWRQRQIRLPVLVMTARSTLEDRLAGLGGGADDYIIKPFATAELVARLHAVLRRTARQADALWVLGPLSLDPGQHQAWLRGEPLNLSPREFQILLELAREPGQVRPKAELAQRLQPLGEPLTHSALEVHVSNLRQKIGAERIQTLRGIGYRLLPDAPP